MLSKTARVYRFYNHPIVWVNVIQHCEKKMYILSGTHHKACGESKPEYQSITESKSTLFGSPLVAIRNYKQHLQACLASECWQGRSRSFEVCHRVDFTVNRLEDINLFSLYNTVENLPSASVIWKKLLKQTIHLEKTSEGQWYARLIG